MNDVELIVYQIGRARIEVGDGESLARKFDANAMAKTQLHAWFGKVLWCVDGYDDDPTELYAIAASFRSGLVSGRIGCFSAPLRPTP